MAMVVMATSTREPFVALGLLSTQVGFGRQRSTAAKSALRRMLVRNHTVGLADVATRFVLAASDHPTAAARAEQAAFGDLVFLNMSESFFDCPRKYLLWLRLARTLYPTARYIAAGDDDVFVALPHLSADLHSVDAGSSDRLVLWGLVTWKAYFNNATYDTSTGFLSWSHVDALAVSRRKRIDECVAELAGSPLARERLLARGEGGRRARSSARSTAYNASAVPACRGLPSKTLSAALRGAVDPQPPFPMVNGPLFALSAELAELVMHDPLPEAWLAGVHATEMARWSAAHGGRVPHLLQSFSCWPMGDSVFGLWLNLISRARHTPLTLVHTPLRKQHFPWPSWAFSNASIVMHGLKGIGNVAFRDFARRKSAGPFVPTERACGPCKQMGWSSWPGDSVVNGWRCCGPKG